MSRAPQGARGLKSTYYEDHLRDLGRAPQGARGLKSPASPATAAALRSRPARGAWIEIYIKPGEDEDEDGRAPQGARGLKYGRIQVYASLFGRAPQGARGLK